jgi:hypothetical protein
MKLWPSWSIFNSSASTAASRRSAAAASTLRPASRWYIPAHRLQMVAKPKEVRPRRHPPRLRPARDGLAECDRIANQVEALVPFDRSKPHAFVVVVTFFVLWGHHNRCGWILK